MAETKLLLAELFAFQGFQVGEHLARKCLVQLKHLENVVQKKFWTFGIRISIQVVMLINTWQSLSPNPAIDKA